MKVRLLTSVILFFLLMIIPTNPGRTKVESLDFRSEHLTSSSMIPLVYGQDISREIFESVSASSFLQHIVDLTGFGPRPGGSTEAMNWIIDTLETISNGRIQPEVVGTTQNVVGILEGYLPEDNPILMVGGHYDTVGGAPGANDDASGVATMLELARVMSKYRWPLDIYFGAWNLEEEGLIGSSEVADIFSSEGIELLAYWNVDMILFRDDIYNPREQIIFGYSPSIPGIGIIGDTMSYNYGNDIIKTAEKGPIWTRSDHYSFYSRGLRNVVSICESDIESDPAYHSPDDIWTNPNYDFHMGAETVASIGASMAYTMARASDSPQKTEYCDILNPSSLDIFRIPTFYDELTIQYITNSSKLSISLTDLENHSYPLQNPTDGLLVSNELSPGEYQIHISNTGSNAIDYEIELSYYTDVDMNSVSDQEEYWFDTPLFNEDNDSDGLNGALELFLGTSDSMADSDNDGMPDLFEVEHNLNPLEDDSRDDADKDELENIYEFLNGTNPQSSDSDTDGIPDVWEVVNGTNPLSNDTFEDQDADTLTNWHEFLNGTFPNNNDSDSDSLRDDWELRYGFDPVSTDDSSLDVDNDGLSNAEEQQYQTNPLSNDSDLDDMPDLWEIDHNLNPLSNDSTEDPDGDSLSNLEEYMNGLNPNLYDIQAYLLLIAGIVVIGCTVTVGINWKMKKKRENDD